MNIYVGNLPYTTQDAELRDIFSAHGEVATAKVIMDRETGRSKGFGFVEMPDSSAATAAIEALNGTDFSGRSLKVNESRPRENNDRPAARSGGFRR
jgi:cold-inducible RNA-binding protein